jgi:hypothetical protein
VALKNSLAAFAQPAPLLLQALLNGPVIAQLVPTKPLRVPLASLLLLWRPHMALRKRKRATSEQDDSGENDRAHERTSLE